MIRTDELAAWGKRSRTIDGITIAEGMAAWNYDFELCRVTGVAHIDANGNVWFRTETPKGGRGSDFDGSRLWAFHPVDRTSAAEAWRSRKR